MTVKIKFSGKIHPFIEDLPIFEDKVDEIAESIDEVGLLHPVTLDQEGQVIGGRHRLTACEVAGVDPTFEVWDGDALAFMLHDNDARKHQTTGQLAAEKALTLDSAGHRQDNGRWKYGTFAELSTSGHSDFRKRVHEAGTILDVLGRESLLAVASGEAELKPLYEQAQSEKSRRERERREREEFEANQAKNEAEAERFFQTKTKAMEWYGAQPEGKYQTWLEAKTGYLAYDKEQAWEEEKARREEERREQTRRESHKRDADRIRAFLGGYDVTYSIVEGTHHDTAEVLDLLAPHDRKRFNKILEETTWPDHRP